VQPAPERRSHGGGASRLDTSFLTFITPAKLRRTNAKRFLAKLEELSGVESPFTTFDLADDLLRLLDPSTQLRLSKSSLFSKRPQ
jgi:hypothetical protein